MQPDTYTDDQYIDTALEHLYDELDFDGTFPDELADTILESRQTYPRDPVSAGIAAWDELYGDTFGQTLGRPNLAAVEYCDVCGAPFTYGPTGPVCYRHATAVTIETDHIMNRLRVVYETTTGRPWFRTPGQLIDELVAAPLAAAIRKAHTT
jgi:hypothetical protein